MEFSTRTKRSVQDMVSEDTSSDYVVVSPGQVISTESGFLRGHGTYVEDGQLIASVAGIVERVNQLISVKPLKSRYIGEVGDIIVGRVADVGNKMWKVDVNGHQQALLMLSSVNLPGGAQRRRTYEDQLTMRTFLKENDLISAEIQDVRYDGTVSLHTRSLRYGQLENGQFVAVQPALIRRLKQHMVTLPGIKVDLIIGNNGYIWISRTMEEDEEESAVLLDDSRVAEVLLEKRRKHAAVPTSQEIRVQIARVYQCILTLNDKFQMIDPDNIMQLYNCMCVDDK